MKPFLLRALPLLSALYVSIRNWIVGKIHLKGSARNLSIMHSVKKLKKKEQRNKRSKKSVITQIKGCALDH
jgi:hypothetical protein